jgi:N-acetylmuramoyl-L-alanine amidase
MRRDALSLAGLVRAAAGAILLLSLFAGRYSWAGANLRSVTIDSSGSELSVLLSLSKELKPRIFRLQNPDRLVIDLPATTADRRLPLPQAVAPIRNLRLGHQAAGSLRLVLELQPGAWPRPAWDGTLKGDGYRLRIGAAPLSSEARPPAVAPAVSAVAAAPVAPPAPVAVRAAHAPDSSDRDLVIAIDAGHGGTDPGASGRDGTQEKRVTLAIARALAERVNREAGLRAVLTRSSDVFVPLRERMERAQAAGAHLFVSIHADAVRDRDIEGASVYVLSDRGASSEAARMLADRENSADLKGVTLADKNPSLASVLLDLSQSASLGSSAEAAAQVLTALDQVGAVRKQQVQHAAFVVLKSPAIPSMLIETAYISNPAEERKLRDPGYQARLADAIFSGVTGYFRAHPPDGTLYARLHRDASTGAGTLARSSP